MEESLKGNHEIIQSQEILRDRFPTNTSEINMVIYYGVQSLNYENFNFWNTSETIGTAVMDPYFDITETDAQDKIV